MRLIAKSMMVVAFALSGNACALAATPTDEDKQSGKAAVKEFVAGRKLYQ